MKKYYENIQEFMEALEQEGELVRIKTPVSRDLEISEIYFRHARSPGGGKALLFENVEGSKIPVLINAFGSHRRMEIAFGGRSLDSIAGQMAELLKITKMKAPSGASEAAKLMGHAASVLKYPPGKLRFSKAPVQEVVLQGDRIDLNEIPILKSWPKDGGRFVTLPLVFTKSLHSGAKNVGMYRMQQLSRDTTAMHWQIHKDGSHYWQEYRKEGKRMPVSVVIGADPSVIFAATAPLPPGINELLMAGFIRGKGVKTVKCITNDLEVPADAEIVLEGYVDPDDMAAEGPFGDHTGYYTPVEKFPVFYITAVTMKKSPVYSATVVGRSPQEDCYLAQATERLFLPLLQVVAPEVKDQMLPWDGNFHNCGVFALEKGFPFAARRLMNHLWGFSQMSFAKSIVVVDSDVNLHTGEELLRHILNSCDPVRDSYITEGVLDQLDHSGLQPLYGGKFGLDATSKYREELEYGTEYSGKARELGYAEYRDIKSGAVNENTPLKHLSEKARKEALNNIIKKLNNKKIPVKDIRLYGDDLRNPVLLISVKKKAGTGKLAGLTADALQPHKTPGFPASVILIFDEGDNLKNGSYVLWKMFGGTDPVRDIVRLPAEGKNRNLRSVLIADCTNKTKADGYLRKWPEENLMDKKTIDLVNRKWKEMFGEEPIEVERP